MAYAYTPTVLFRVFGAPLRRTGAPGCFGVALRVVWGLPGKNLRCFIQKFYKPIHCCGGKLIKMVNREHCQNTQTKETINYNPATSAVRRTRALSSRAAPLRLLPRYIDRRGACAARCARHAAATFALETTAAGMSHHHGRAMEQGLRQQPEASTDANGRLWRLNGQLENQERPPRKTTGRVRKSKRPP